MTSTTDFNSPEFLRSLEEPTILCTADLPAWQYRSSSYQPPRQLEQLLDINDPLLDVPCGPEWPDTPAGKIAALLDYVRGVKLTRCRHGGFIFKFPDGSRGFRPAYACRMTIVCFECAVDQALEQFGKYRSLIDFLPAEQFTRMTIRLADNLPPSERVDQIMALLDRTLPKLPTVAKIKPASDTLEILYCAELTREEVAAVRAAYPTMRLHRYHTTHFHRELHRVLDAEPFATPESAAAADTKYFDIRLLRVHGLSREERRNLTLVQPTRVNFAEASPDSPPGGGSSGGFSPSPEESDLPREQPAAQPASIPNPPIRQHYHRTASGRLWAVPSCSCGCGAAPVSFAKGMSKDDNSPDLNWIDIDLVTKEESIQ